MDASDFLFLAFLVAVVLLAGVVMVRSLRMQTRGLKTQEGAVADMREQIARVKHSIELQERSLALQQEGVDLLRQIEANTRKE